MGARTDTRQRMIDAAKAGFRTNGYAATSFSDVLERSGAARGAIYHHFPGGRQELTVAAISSTADNIAIALEHAAADHSPREGFHRAIAGLTDLVAREHGGSGCPITPAILDAAGDTDVLAAGDVAFRRWQQVLIDHHGLDQSAAALVVAAIEGALVMCRAARSSEPLELVAERLAPFFPAKRRARR